MDLSVLGAASAALTAAREIGKAAIGLRDFNQLAAVVSQLNDQILKAQESLFSHQAQLIGMQEELFKAKENIRAMEKMVEQRERYSLIELSAGVFTYRLNDRSALGDGVSEPIHCICQPCLDIRGHKSVLLRKQTSQSITHVCPSCNAVVLESKNANYSPAIPFRC